MYCGQFEDPAEAAECSRDQPIPDDQEGVFELYVQSNETTKDGLLEWVQESPRGQPVAWNQEVPLATCGVTVKVDECSDVESRDGDDWTNTSRSISPMADEPCFQRATTKIQAGFRGYRTRKQLKRRRTPLPQAEAIPIQIQAAYRDYRVRHQLKYVADDVHGSGQESEEKPMSGHRPQQTRKQVKTKRKRF